jgi:hypothetical protein
VTVLGEQQRASPERGYTPLAIYASGGRIANTVTNNGTLEATNGGTLALIGAFNNDSGTILGTGASSVVELSGSTITGGTLTTASGGTIQNSSAPSKRPASN